MTFYTDLLIFHTVSIFYCVLWCSQKLAAAAKKTDHDDLPQNSLASPPATDLHICDTREFGKVAGLFA